MSSEEVTKEEPKKKFVAATLTDKEIEQVALSTKQLLDKQQKFKIRIRKDSDPKMPNYETVQVNGYTYTIMKGVDVEVPETVRDILVNANII
jgi:hypothetical protein